MGPCDAATLERVRRATGEDQVGSAARSAHHLHLLAAQSPSAPDGLQESLLGGQARGEMHGGSASRVTIGSLALPEDAAEETLPILPQESFHPVHLAQVDADSEDHASSRPREPASEPTPQASERKVSNTAPPSDSIFR